MYGQLAETMRQFMDSLKHHMQTTRTEELNQLMVEDRVSKRRLTLPMKRWIRPAQAEMPPSWKQVSDCCTVWAVD